MLATCFFSRLFSDISLFRTRLKSISDTSDGRPVWKPDVAYLPSTTLHVIDRYMSIGISLRSGPFTACRNHGMPKGCRWPWPPAAAWSLMKWRYRVNGSFARQVYVFIIRKRKGLQGGRPPFTLRSQQITVTTVNTVFQTRKLDIVECKYRHNGEY